VKELLLDGAGWLTKDDVYDAFFRVVGTLDRKAKPSYRSMPVRHARRV